VHCEDQLLAAALELFARERIDQILCVGDIVDGPGDPSRCIELLGRHRVDCVAGNHDRWYLAGQARTLPDALPAGTLSRADEAWLRALPRTRTYADDDLLLCHGLGEDDMATVKPDDFGYALESNTALQALLRERHAIVVCGHSHRRCVLRFGETTIVNAGTLFREHDPCALVLELPACVAQFHDL
jgi:predicted phosphodiesterase